MKIIFLLFFIYSCSNLGIKTIKTLDNTKRPSWATMANGSVYQRDGQLYYVGVSEHPYSSTTSLNSLYELSDLKARAELSKYISSKIKVSIAESENFSGIDFMQIQRNLLSDVNVLQSRIDKRWYEVNLETTNKGQSTKITVYSLLKWQKPKEVKIVSK